MSVAWEVNTNLRWLKQMPLKAGLALNVTGGLLLENWYVLPKERAFWSAEVLSRKTTFELHEISLTCKQFILHTFRLLTSFRYLRISLLGLAHDACYEASIKCPKSLILRARTSITLLVAIRLTLLNRNTIHVPCRFVWTEVGIPSRLRSAWTDEDRCNFGRPHTFEATARG